MAKKIEKAITGNVIKYQE
uniref:Uncharacterized protein n=1 Tax=Anguilla anguilla TaxID=7936 RepID=A0A0E9VRP2_ANGAN